VAIGIQSIIKPVYHLTHDVINMTYQWNRKRNFIGKGHISDEHLADPSLDDALVKALKKAGISTSSYSIPIDRYKQYIEKVRYPASYYGGKPGQNNFTEKTLEHFISLEFLDLAKNSVIIDVAAASSPFANIVRKHFGVKKSYQQDLIFPIGMKGNRLGGSAETITLPDKSVHGVTLHCALEHFEANSDIGLFKELDRILVPGGKAVILPFYLAHEFTNHVDPAFNLLKQHHISPDEGARIRYCTWYQYFSRHYDVSALKSRILDQAKGLDLTVYQVNNFKDVDPECYLRFVGVFTKK